MDSQIGESFSWRVAALGSVRSRMTALLFTGAAIGGLVTSPEMTLQTAVVFGLAVVAVITTLDV